MLFCMCSGGLGDHEGTFLLVDTGVLAFYCYCHLLTRLSNSFDAGVLSMKKVELSMKKVQYLRQYRNISRPQSDLQIDVAEKSLSCFLDIGTKNKNTGISTLFCQA